MKDGMKVHGIVIGSADYRTQPNEPRCTPGSEFQCAVATSFVCHCACGGKNHGKHPSLRKIRNEHGLNSSESLQLLHERQRHAKNKT